MEKVERVNIVTELYGLRAGLSAISQKKDEMERYSDKMDNEIKTAERRVDKITDEASSIKSEITQSKDKIESFKQLKSEALDEGLNARNRSEYRKTIVKRFFGTVILPIIMLAAAVGVWFGLNSRENDFIERAGGWVLSIGGVVGVIIYFVKAQPYNWGDGSKPDSKKKRQKQANDYEEDISNEQDKIIKIEERLKENACALDRAIATRGDIEEQKEKGIVPYVLCSNAVYAALKEKYNDMLDVRDWENLDYIIYTLETRRADSIKEALQQVDMERRKNEIVAAIGEATRAVCSAIQQGFRDTQYYMVTCFQAISKQIEANMAEQSARLESIGNSVRGLANQVDLNSALVSKAAASSTQLAKDVQYMSLLADNAEVRRRNNM